MIRTAAKRDSVEADIVAALRRIGCLVMHCNGVPFDLLVQYRGVLIAAEVKTGKAKLKPSQEEAIAMGWRIQVWRSTDDALRTIESLLEKYWALHKELT